MPNTRRKNRYWHWSDLNNGVELDFFGTVYRLCSCNLYTKQFLSSKGIVIGPDEPLPDDPYMVDRWTQKRLAAAASKACFSDRSAANDKAKQFLAYDGQILRYVRPNVVGKYEYVVYPFGGELSGSRNERRLFRRFSGTGACVF